MCASQDANTRIFLYADDAKIYKVINQLSDQADLQVTLNTVKNWSDEWLLRLNIDKCKMVSYYRICSKSKPEAELQYGGRYGNSMTCHPRATHHTPHCTVK